MTGIRAFKSRIETTVAAIRRRLEKSNLAVADLIALGAAYSFFGTFFVLGALLKPKKMAIGMSCFVAAMATGFVYIVYWRDIDAGYIDPFGHKFLFGSSTLGTAAAVAIGHTAIFVAGVLAGAAYRGLTRNTRSVTLAALAATVFFAGIAPIRQAQVDVAEILGRVEAKSEFYGKTMTAINELREKHPDVDFKPVVEVMIDQMQSVTFKREMD